MFHGPKKTRLLVKQRKKTTGRKREGVKKMIESPKSWGQMAWHQRIVFRAWHQRKREWHYFELPRSIQSKQVGVVESLFSLSEEESRNYSRWGQWTGFQDISGTRIFDGDVVDWKDGRGIVYWDAGGGQWLHSYRGKLGNRFDGWSASKKLWHLVKVIGNIHQSQRFRDQLI